MSAIEWGSVGEWIGGLGSIAAVLVALWIARSASRDSAVQLRAELAAGEQSRDRANAVSWLCEAAEIAHQAAMCAALLNTPDQQIVDAKQGERARKMRLHLTQLRTLRVRLMGLGIAIPAVEVQPKDGEVFRLVGRLMTTSLMPRDNGIGPYHEWLSSQAELLHHVEIVSVEAVERISELSAEGWSSRVGGLFP